MTNQYQKVKVLRALEAQWCINLFESTPGPFTKVDEKLWKMATQVFRLRRANPNTQDQALKTYTDVVNKVFAKSLVSKQKTS